MKQLASIFLLCVGFAVTSYGQSAQVVSAWNYVKNGDLPNARKSIDQAIQDEKTQTWSKTWFYRATIYEATYSDTNQRKAVPGALDEAIKSYNKALALDTKGEYKDQILAGLQDCALYSFNEGVQPYNDKNFDAAYQSFKRSSGIYDTINKYYKKNGVDTMATLYEANAAVRSNHVDEGIQLYQSLLSKNISTADIYADLGSAYLQKGDTAKATEIIAKGVQLFPDDKNLMVQQLNLTLGSNDSQKAIDQLKAAIAKDPKFTSLYIQLGNMYEQMKDTANARKTYEQAIQLDPNNFDAFYRYGALYYNQAVEVNNQMNKLSLDQQKQYDQLKTSRDVLFKKSMPYLEKAHELNAKDMDTMGALKELYARLNMTDKMNQIKQEMGQQ